MRNTRVKAAQVQDEIDRAPVRPRRCCAPASLPIEQQKLERYQQRYEEYIKTAKALAAFADLSTLRVVART